jgi:carbonic anhydrase
MFLTLSVAQATGTATDSAPVVTPSAALKRLVQANQRFVDGKPAQRSDIKRRLSLVDNQHPFAVILGCSDSRVSPEIIFDQGLGDLFVIRVAGNLAGVDECGSIEYAVEHLGAPLVVVLGHESCGAVTAAFGTDAEKRHEPPELQHLLAHITPSLEGLSSSTVTSRKVHDGVAANLRAEVDKLRKLPIISEKVKQGTLQVVGGVYDLATGSVKFLDID